MTLPPDQQAWLNSLDPIEKVTILRLAAAGYSMDPDTKLIKLPEGEKDDTQVTSTEAGRIALLCRDYGWRTDL